LESRSYICSYYLSLIESNNHVFIISLSYVSSLSDSILDMVTCPFISPSPMHCGWIASRKYWVFYYLKELDGDPLPKNIAENRFKNSPDDHLMQDTVNCRHINNIWELRPRSYVKDGRVCASGGGI
jgi:hypothetical protein